MRHSWLTKALFLATFATVFSAQADQNVSDVEYTLSTSLWTKHFNPQPDHNNTQSFVGIERRGINMVSTPLNARFPILDTATPLLGLAFFNNSFSQSTVYAYAGYDYDVWRNDTSALYSKITAGFIHGYRDDYQEKIPFNHFGTSPAAIPSIGFRYKQLDSELALFGISGVMLLIGYRF